MERASSVAARRPRREGACRTRSEPGRVKRRPWRNRGAVLISLAANPFDKTSSESC